MIVGHFFSFNYFQSQGEQHSEYVELKVTTETIVRAHWAFNQKRLVPWWCQSVVAGTPLIVYGTRDYYGHVKTIQGIRTDEIPDRVGLENLDKDKYLLLLSDMLSWIKNTVCVEEDGTVYMIEWDPNSQGTGVTAKVLPRDLDKAFLRDWYINEMEDYYARPRREQQRSSENQVPRASIPRDRRSPCLATTGREKRRLLEPDWNRKEETEEMGEAQREQEMKMNLINRRFEESWPRTTSVFQSVDDLRFQQESLAEESSDWTFRTANAGERSVRDLEMPRSRERGAQYQQSRSSGFYEADYKRTTLATDDPRSWSKSDAVERGERKRECSKPRKEDHNRKRRVSPLAEDEKFDRDQQISRFRGPPSPYSRGNRKKAFDQTRTGRRKEQDQQRMRSRAQSGRKAEGSRPWRSRAISPPCGERLSPNTGAKRVKRDEEYNGRRPRHRGSTRHGIRTKTT